MSKDYRAEFITAVERSLVALMSADQAHLVSDIVLKELANYEIMERSTELAPIDDGNVKLLKRYLACCMIDGKSEKTIYGYERALIRLDEFLARPFTEVGTYDIRYYLACEKEKGLAATSLENTRSMLSAFFQWMLDEEIIQRNPCAKIKPIKCPNKKKHPFSSVEIDALRSACKSLKERAIVETLLSSGIRVEELTKLRLTDVDFQNMVVSVKNGKGGKDRTTYITELAKVHIQKYILARKDTIDSLICNKNHQPITTNGIRSILKSIGERAGVDNVHPHRFRRTFATDLASRGMDVQDIQVLLGHSSINTTMKYVSMDDTKVAASYRKYVA